MQSLAAWQGACDGSTGKLDFSTATLVGLGTDIGGWPGDGLTAYTAFADNMKLGSKQWNFEADPTSTVAPEPASVVLMASGLLGVAGFARRRRKA